MISHLRLNDFSSQTEWFLISDRMISHLRQNDFSSQTEWLFISDRIISHLRQNYISSQAELFLISDRPNWKRWDLEQGWRCSLTWAADSLNSSPMSLLTFPCHKCAFHMIFCFSENLPQSPGDCWQVLQCRLVCSTWRDFIDMEVLAIKTFNILLVIPFWHYLLEMRQVVERHPDTVRERLWRTGVEEHSMLYCGGEVPLWQ